MYLPTKRPTRRQFLERSALGAGSLLVAPLLLESCTDHVIPPTNPNPPTQPPLLDDGIDWNELVKNAVSDGLGEIPEVGTVLSKLVDIFWPNEATVGPWEQVKDQVNQLIDQKLNETLFDQASGKLDDLKAILQDYEKAIKDSTPAEINSKWGDIVTSFDSNQSVFKLTGYEVMLLPLFTQYTNLYLSLLRDPLLPTKQDPSVMTGSTWGMTDADLDTAYGKLNLFIGVAQTYAGGWYQHGRDFITNATAKNDVNIEPFTSLNKYDRQMTMLVLDYMDTWAYYDIRIYKNGTPKNSDGTPIYMFNREIYSDPYGNCFDSGNIILPGPSEQFPTHLTVWAFDRIDAVQVGYGGTSTVRMGDQPDGHGSGGTNQLPIGGSFDISPTNPITNFQLYIDSWEDVRVGPLLLPTGMRFKFSDGTITPPGTYSFFGAQARGLSRFDTGWIGYPNMALSSVYINGVNKLLGTADCIVFGFKRWPRA